MQTGNHREKMSPAESVFENHCMKNHLGAVALKSNREYALPVIPL